MSLISQEKQMIVTLKLDVGDDRADALDIAEQLFEFFWQSQMGLDCKELSIDGKPVFGELKMKYANSVRTSASSEDNNQTKEGSTASLS